MISPGSSHLRPAAFPHCQVYSVGASHGPTNLWRFNFTPDAAPKRSMTVSALSILSLLPSKNSCVLFVNIWLVMVVLSGNRSHWTLHYGCWSIWPSMSTVSKNRYGARGQPCLTDLWRQNALDCSPLTMTDVVAFSFSDINWLIQVWWNPIFFIVCRRKVQLARP